jgi:cell division septal protein FtsQ
MARTKRKRNKVKEKHKKVDYKGVWVLLFLLVISAGLFFAARALYYSPIFIVKEVKSNIELSQNLIKSIKGKSLFTVDINRIYHQILNNNPAYQQVYVFKEFPSAVVVDVVERDAFAQIKTEKFYPIDRQGVVIDTGSSNPLPNLIPIEIGGGPFARGQTIKDEGMQLSLSLIEALAEENIIRKFPITVINARSPQALYFLIGDTKIIVGRGNYKHKLYIFTSVVREKLKGNLSSVKYIDLRYKKVYLGYKR